MSDKLRAGVIGCGGMGSRHVQGYLDRGRYDVVALADLSAAAMKEYEESFGEYDEYVPSHYTDASDMLDSEDRGFSVFGFKGGARAELFSDLTPKPYLGLGGVFYGSEGIIDLHEGYLRLLNSRTGGEWEHKTPTAGSSNRT